MVGMASWKRVLQKRAKAKATSTRKRANKSTTVRKVSFQ
jgi:hypothetical protein